MGFHGGSVVKNPPANSGDVSSIPGSGRSPGEGNGNPLQYSCLGDPMDRGAWQTPWGCKRVGHDLATKQQWQIHIPCTHIPCRISCPCSSSLHPLTCSMLWAGREGLLCIDCSVGSLAFCLWLCLADGRQRAMAGDRRREVRVLIPCLLVCWGLSVSFYHRPQLLSSGSFSHCPGVVLKPLLLLAPRDQVCFRLPGCWQPQDAASPRGGCL